MSRSHEVSGLRAHWFRYSAQKARWTEEVNTVREEMFRTLRSYEHNLKKWQSTAEECEAQGRLGAAAYARRWALTSWYLAIYSSHP